jgi:hypothetical protein
VGGTITIKAANDIKVGHIRSFGGSVPGSVNITSSNGDMQIEAIDSSCSAGNCPGGDINLKAAGNITLNTGGLLSVYLSGASGDITLQSGNSISIPIIYYNGGGAINLSAPNSIQLGKIVPYDATTPQIPGSITITSNEIDFTGSAPSVQATSSPLILQSFTPNQNIVIGGLENPSTLDLSATDLAALSKDFSAVTIGRSDGTGTITVTGDVTFNYPVTLQAEGVGGSLNWVNGNITGTGNASITLKADQDITTGSIINSGRNITISSTNGNINTTAGTLDVSSSLGNGGAIDLTAASGIQAGTIDISTTSSNSTTAAGKITLNPGTGNITVEGDINVSAAAGSGGNVTFLTPVFLTQPTTTLTTSGTTSSGNVSFNSTLDGRAIGSQSLIVNASTGNISFGGAVGSTTALGNITANSTATTIFKAVNAANLTTNPGGTTQLNGNVTTTGNQTYSDAVIIANDPTLTGNGITFNSTLDGNSDITANAGSGNLTFNGRVGTPTKPLGNLTANSQGTTAFNQTVDAASLTTDALGTTQLNSNVTTTSSQTYSDAVTIAKDATLTGNGITFNDAVDGSSNLTAKAGSGNLTFNGRVGTPTKPLGNLTANSQGTTAFNQTVDAASLTTDALGTTQLNSNVTTTGSQTYSDAVTIAKDATLTGNGITFNDAVDGSSNLTAKAGSGNLTFNGRVGTPTKPLGNLTANSQGTTAFNQTVDAASLTTDALGTTQLNSNVTTTGSQTYSDAVTIAKDATLTGNGITFNDAVDGSSNLTAKAGSGNLTFNGRVGTPTKPLGNLTANSQGTTAFNQTVDAASLTTDAGGTTQLNSNVTTTGSQTYSDAVTIAKDATLTGNGITFNDAVDGSSNLTAKAGSGNLTFNGRVGTPTKPLGNLTANSQGTTAFNQTVDAASLTTDAGGTTQLNGNVTTTGSQTYSDAVTIAKDAISPATVLLSTML